MPSLILLIPTDSNMIIQSSCISEDLKPQMKSNVVLSKLTDVSNASWRISVTSRNQSNVVIRPCQYKTNRLHRSLLMTLPDNIRADENQFSDMISHYVFIPLLCHGFIRQMHNYNLSSFKWVYFDGQFGRNIFFLL